MTTGHSGLSSPIVGLYPADTSTPQPSTDFQLREFPGVQDADVPNELALFKFQFTKPTLKVHTVSDALTPESGMATPVSTTRRLLRIPGVIGQSITVSYDDGNVYEWITILETGTGLDEGYLVAEISDDNIETALTPADYSVLTIADFGATSTFINYAGFRLYMSELQMTSGSFGGKIQSYYFADAAGTGDVSKITLNTTTQVEFQFAAPDTFYAGRKMYFAITHIDQTFPTPNESPGDINAWAVSKPGQPTLLNKFVLDVSDPSNAFITVNFDKITNGGYNPHLKEMMGTDIDPAKIWSFNGGYDIFKHELIAINFTDGYYDGIDATQGIIYDTQILSGAILCIIDAGKGQAWQVKAVKDGEVTISDTSLINGSRTGLDYATTRTSASFYVYQGTIDIENDSILPLNDAMPVKQYLTDAVQEYDDTTISIGKKYGYAIMAVDTELAYGKISS